MEMRITALIVALGLPLTVTARWLEHIRHHTVLFVVNLGTIAGRSQERPSEIPAAFQLSHITV